MRFRQQTLSCWLKLFQLKKVNIFLNRKNPKHFESSGEFALSSTLSEFRENRLIFLSFWLSRTLLSTEKSQNNLYPEKGKQKTHHHPDKFGFPKTNIDDARWNSGDAAEIAFFFLRRQNIQIYVNLINKMILFCFSFHFFHAVEFYPAFICVTKLSRLFFEKMINPLLNLSTGAAVLFTMLSTNLEKSFMQMLWIFAGALANWHILQHLLLAQLAWLLLSC